MAKVNGMKPIWNKANITKMFDKLQDEAEFVILELLKRAGEEFVKLARENGSYKDQTGNLRSSVGYVIVNNGAITAEDFEQVKYGNKGTQEARQLCADLAREYATGYVLIGVAGMNYAAAVEAKGYDVISLSADKTEDFIKDLAKRLFDRLNIG